VSALELEDAFELSLVRVGIVVKRLTLEGRGFVPAGLDRAAFDRTDLDRRIENVRNAVPGRIGASRVVRRQRHDREAVRLHLDIDMWAAPTIDRRPTRYGFGTASAPVHDDRELSVRAHCRMEGRDECAGPKRIAGDDAEVSGRRKFRRCFGAIRLDWVGTLLRHWSPFPAGRDGRIGCDNADAYSALR